MKSFKASSMHTTTDPGNRVWLARYGLVALIALVAASFFFLQRYFDFFPPAFPLANSSTGSNLQTHYLPDFEYSVDEENGFGRIPHLSVFNPGAKDALLTITIFHEKREPSSFQQVIPARSSFESDASEWSIPLNSRFGMKIESTEPIIAQATEGWNNTKNDYSLNSSTASANIPRETAKSYVSQTSLAQECYIADGVIIDVPEAIWIKETEDLAVLNPNKQDMTLTIQAYFGHRDITRFEIPLDIPVVKKQVQIPAERVGLISVTDWIRPNWHYGARITANQPFAAQWLRMVYWYDSAELMSEWSVPCVQVS